MDAAYLGIGPRQLDTMEPRELDMLMEGNALWWSNLSELVAWAVWQIVLSIPYSGREKAGGDKFSIWLRRNTPPFFIPPNRRN